jgi:Zn-dependent metalloprotease
VAQRKGLRRQIFDAKNTNDLPGDLVRTEGDAPVADPIVNEVYDNLDIVYRFFKDVFGWEIPDNIGKTLVVTIHYANYNNGFRNGQQIVLGDGDGIIFSKGGFSSLSLVARYMGYAMNQYTAQLAYQDQSGALNTSFADIFGCLVEQWKNKQTSEEASWLVGAAIMAPGFRGRALRDMANPGTAYDDDPNLGKDPQPGHMKDYVQTEWDHGGVHTNSGIPSRAFVLAAKAIGGNSWEKLEKFGMSP